MVFRATVLFALAMMLAPGPASAAAELPLGPRSLDERRSSAEVAPGVRWTRIAREGGPWRVNVLRIDPDARVLVAPAGDAVGERARPSALARGLSAVAAVNGGYFAADGNPAGALAAGGVLVSEPVGGRTALLLGASRSLAALGFQGEVEASGPDAAARRGQPPAGPGARVWRSRRRPPDRAPGRGHNLHRPERADCLHAGVGRAHSKRRSRGGGARRGRHQARSRRGAGPA